MAFTHGCSAGWLASVCALTSARWPRTGSTGTATQPSCTSWLPVTLACPLRFSSGTRRAPCSYLLRLWRPRLSPRMRPLQTALHLWSRGLMPPCHQDSTPAASIVSWRNGKSFLFPKALRSPVVVYEWINIFRLIEVFVGPRSYVGWLRQGNLHWNQSSNQPRCAATV